jgi:O-antigen/teichoic acid export membrane protein
MPLAENRTLATTRRSLPIVVGLVAAQGIGAVTLVVAARQLGPQHYGAAMAVVGIATFSATVLDFGGAAHATRALSRAQPDYKDFAGRLGARACIALVALLAAFVVSGFVSGSAVLFAAVPALAAMVSLEQSALAPFRAVSANIAVSVLLACEKLATLLTFSIAVVMGHPDAEMLVVALIAGPALTSLLAAIWAHYGKVLPHLFAYRPRPASPWRGMVHLGIGNIALGAQYLDAQVVTVFSGAGSAGEYIAVARAAGPLGLAATGLTQTIFPEMSRSASDRAAFRILTSALRLMAIPSVGLLLIAAWPDRIVELVLGSAYADAGPILRVLAVALIASLLAQPISAFLQARNAEKSTGRILVFGVGMQLLLMAILSYRWGGLGAAWAFATAQMMILSLMIRASHGLLGRGRMRA